MVVQLTNGTAVTKAGVSKSAFTADDAQFTLGTDLWEVTEIPGSTTKTRKRRLARAGDVVRQSDLNRWWPTASITGISPATGATAGGTAITVTGTNLRGVTGVTFGGTAGTSVVAVNETTVTCVSPAKSAGAYDVIAADDSGATNTLTGAYTAA